MTLRSDNSILLKDCLYAVTEGGCQSVTCIINGTVTGPNAALAPIVLLTKRNVGTSVLGKQAKTPTKN